MINHIHILGASGSGASTLGHELSLLVPHVNFDGDDYFWRAKFTEPREPKGRLVLLQEDLSSCKQWILSGAVCGWGDALRPCFDLVIFIYTPPAIRLQRLQAREFQRYGNEIELGGNKYEQSKAFMQWAARYDEAGLEIRSRALHEHWLADLDCPVLKIEGDFTVQERVDRVLNYLAHLPQ